MSTSSQELSGQRQKSNSDPTNVDDIDKKFVKFSVGESLTDDSDGSLQVNGGVKRRNPKLLRSSQDKEKGRRTKSLYGVSPNCKFGPCGTILDNSATSLSWYSCDGDSLSWLQKIHCDSKQSAAEDIYSCHQRKGCLRQIFPRMVYIPMVAVLSIGFSLISIVTCLDYSLNVNTSDVRNDISHFWRSTGFCPPLPHQDAYKFDYGRDVKLNIALIGSVPHSGIKQVRIHWLLDLVIVNDLTDTGFVSYNFSKLDDVIEMLWKNGLKPGFELMGNPSNFFTDFEDTVQLFLWRDLVNQLAFNYIQKYGISEVMEWNFETWNEPDCHDFDNFKISVQGFLNYYDACSEGLLAASPLLKLGGPGDGCDRLGHSQYADALLAHVVNGTNFFTKQKGVRIDFLSFHRKGGGHSSKIYEGELEILSKIHKKYPSLAKVPFFNDEADPLVGWSKDQWWRADVTYAAVVVKVIAQHQNMILANHSSGINYSLLSNDNGFLSYYPSQFTQRTLLARFQMNNSLTPYVQFIIKPIYSAMVGLSLLGDQQLHADLSVYQGIKGFTVVGNDSDVGVLATIHKAESGIKTADSWQVAVLLYSSVDTSSATQTNSVTLNMTLNEIKDIAISVYRLDPLVSDPYAIWLKQGKPKFPTIQQFQEMRAQEGLFRMMLKYIKTDVIYIHEMAYLFQPGILLVHACAKSELPPNQVTGLTAYNITVGQILLVWSDGCVNTKCILKYDVEYSPKSESGPYSPVDLNSDSIITAYFYVPNAVVQSDDLVKGYYRVRAVDYFQRPGIYSIPLKYS